MNELSAAGDSASCHCADALAACRRQVELLQAELDETNQGVVALYTELDEKARELQRATELKSRFLSYMSHEFRVPVGAIRSVARLLSDNMDGSLTEEQRKQVGFIQTAAAEFSEMIDDLLDLAKIEAGRVEISPAWFEMVDLFSALRGVFKPVLTNPQLALIFEPPAERLKLFTDNRKLAQILRNFISNALKFTEHGEIRVTVARVDENKVSFAVSDTGIGIAPEHHAALFNDFTQIGSPIQKRFRGTGLGLALSKQLATLLGGYVNVQSALGNGATFSVTLPIELPGFGHDQQLP